MRRNESPEFVGLEYLKKKHAAQIAEFEQWASERDWMAFHNSHYDWWTFPYGCNTSSYGAAYAIYETAKKGNFVSREDFALESGVSKTVIQNLADLGAMDDLPDTNQMSLF